MRYSLPKPFWLALLMSTARLAAGVEVTLPVQAVDPLQVVVPNVRFTYQGIESPPTTDAGVTEIRIVLGPGRKLLPGTAIELGIPKSTATSWLLIDDTVHVPGPGEPPAEVVLLRRTDMHRLGEAMRGVIVEQWEPSIADKRRIILEFAEDEYGLSEAELEKAIAEFRTTARGPFEEALAHFLDQEYPEAENLFRTALLEARQRRDAAEEEFVQSAHYLAQTLWHQGRIREALQPLREAVDVASDNPEFLAFYALILSFNAQWEEAEHLFREALDLQSARYGSEDVRVAPALIGLGNLLGELYRFKEAEPLLRQALDILQSHYGPEHPHVATATRSLANLLSRTNRFDEAEQLIRRALAMNQAIEGPAAPSVGESLNELADLLIQTDRMTEAEPLLRQALEINRTTFGPDHLGVVRSESNLARILMLQREVRQAEILLNHVLEIKEESYGPSHPEVAKTIKALSPLLFMTNRQAEAERLLLKAVEIDTEIYGRDHPAVALGLYMRGVARMAQGHSSNAEALMRRSLEIFRASYRAPHPSVATSMVGLAVLLGRTQRPEEAESLLREALEMHTEILGPDHIQVGLTLLLLAQLLVQTDREEEAGPLLQRGWEIFAANPWSATVRGGLSGLFPSL